MALTCSEWPGDGTQALVAGITAEHGLPFLVISAGTRNHFALDLGLDREDPATCLDALTDGEELRGSGRHRRSHVREQRLVRRLRRGGKGRARAFQGGDRDGDGREAPARAGQAGPDDGANGRA